ncbi:uncharacterized protein LOC128553225, partial [Mercenaria mercenaria]|uniref:uncharacterized protein LOC128553225 n=1 Tax=Mercenaria mercenaria TaxID=6596 RepID=UPI00234F7185
MKRKVIGDRTHFILSDVMAVNKSVTKDIKFYKRVLHKSQQRFLEDLDPGSILDLFLERDYLPYTQVRDIQEQRLTSDKTREIIKKVSAKGVGGYETFKALLRESHQEHLTEFLDKQEKTLAKEIKMEEKKKEEKDKQARARETVAPVQPGNKRIPDDRELSAISAHIGMNWEMLGPLLEVSTPTIDQIKLDFSSTRQRIFRLLYEWSSMKGPDATVESLLSQMKKASEVNITWDNVEETIKLFDSEEKRKTDRNTLQSAAGAIPKTGMSEQSGYDETNAINRMQLLNLGIPQENSTEQNKQDQPASSVAESNNISLQTMQRELGNTRRQGEFFSNENFPDLSRKSFVTENRPDGQPYKGAQVGKSGQLTNADETDAVRMRSLEGKLNAKLPLPTFSPANTAGTSGVTQATTTSDTSTATYAIASDGKALEALVDSNTANANSGGNVTVEQSQSDEDVMKSISNIKLNVGILEKKLNVGILENVVSKEQTRDRDCDDDNKEEREARLKAIFATGKDMRLKVLTPGNVKDLLSSCGNEPEHKGGFGDIYV